VGGDRSSAARAALPRAAVSGLARALRNAPLLTALALAAWTSPATAADPDFRDGLWKVDVVTEMRGRGMKPAPPYSYQGCYSRRDMTERLAAPGGPCRALPTEAREGEMSWRLQCSPKVGDVSGSIHMKFMGERMEGTISTRTGYPEPMEVTQRVSGRRVGDCKSAPRQPVPGTGAQPRAKLKDYDETK
jgi:hypothetical protein